MLRSRYRWTIALLFLLLTSCAPSGASDIKQMKQTPPMKRPTTVATLLVPFPTLGPVPQNCPISNPSHQIISSNLSAVIGKSPVWATWPLGPSMYRVPPDLTYPNSYVAFYGWEMTKVIWEVGPDYTQPITIKGSERFDHTPLFIQIGGDGIPTPNAVLNPLHPDHPFSGVGNNWAEWGSYLIVPKAGCYSLEVSWPMGHWTVTFAFGR